VMWRHRVNVAAGDLMHLMGADRVEPAPNRQAVARAANRN
jgi:hypothetical protein